MLVGAHRIEINTLPNGARFVLNGKRCIKTGESSPDTEDWEIEYRDEFTNSVHHCGPYILVKRGNK